MKRFTETTKWDDPWFIRLPPLRKLFWNYICDRCDPSGVIEIAPEVASVQIGTEVNESWIADFGSRVQKLTSGKWQIVKFMPFQYGTVSATCPGHINVIRAIQSNGLNHPITNQPSTRAHARSTLSHRVSDRDKKGKERTLTRARPQNQAEVQAYCASIGLPTSDGDAMWLHWEEKGWAKIKDWKLTNQKWKSFGYLPSQRHKASTPQSKPKQPAPLYDKLPGSRTFCRRRSRDVGIAHLHRGRIRRVCQTSKVTRAASLSDPSRALVKACRGPS